MPNVLMKSFAQGVAILVFSILPWADLWAAPICPALPGAYALGAQPAESTDTLVAEVCGGTWEFMYTALPDRSFEDTAVALPMHLAALAATKPGPPASTLLIIGAAMIWLGGVIRYSPRFQD